MFDHSLASAAIPLPLSLSLFLFLSDPNSHSDFQPFSHFSVKEILSPASGYDLFVSEISDASGAFIAAAPPVLFFS